MDKFADRKKEILESLPFAPGCYIFKGEEESILYVGKSKSLRKRVASYFRVSRDSKFDAMIRIAIDFEFIETKTDIEAQILEFKLIKKYRPPFNARMKKDRGEWFIKFTPNTYPRIYVTNDASDDGSFVIGSFYSKDSAYGALLIIGEYWKLPTCEADFNKKVCFANFSQPVVDTETKGFGRKMRSSFLAHKNKRPCLRGQINQCLSPCSGDVDIETYNETILTVKKFCSGENNLYFFELKNQIAKAAEEWAFEKAAFLQTKLETLKILARQIKYAPPPYEGKVYIVFAKSKHDEVFVLGLIKNGVALFWEFFNASEKLTKTKIKSFLKTKEIKPEGHTFANAVIEVDATRYFIDVTTISKALLANTIFDAYSFFVYQ